MRDKKTGESRHFCNKIVGEFGGSFADCLSVILAVLISTQTDVEYCVLKSMRVKLISAHLNYNRKKEELGFFFPLKEVGPDSFFTTVSLETYPFSLFK